MNAGHGMLCLPVRSSICTTLDTIARDVAGNSWGKQASGELLAFNTLNIMLRQKNTAA